MGHAGGRRRFAGPGGPQNQSMGGAKGPRPCFVRAVRARRPPGPLEFSTGQTVHPPTFPASPSNKQNEPAAPDERRASIIRCKPRKVFQQVFPRFFQKRARGCGGRVAPHTTTLANCGRGAGSPPHGDAQRSAGQSPVKPREAISCPATGPRARPLEWIPTGGSVGNSGCARALGGSRGDRGPAGPRTGSRR